MIWTTHLIKYRCRKSQWIYEYSQRPNATLPATTDSRNAFVV